MIMAQAIMFLVMHHVASLAYSHFLPIKEDPADALADKLIEGAGMESSESMLIPARLGGMNWKKPVQPEPAKSKTAIVHTRLAPQDLVKLQPALGASNLVTPKEWDTSPSETDAPQGPPKTSEPLKSTLVNDETFFKEAEGEAYHEMVEQPEHAETSKGLHVDEVEQELDSISPSLKEQGPKEIVKVSHRDTIVRAPASKSPEHGLVHLGKSIDAYGPVAEEKPVDPDFTLHHGHYHPTAAPAIPASKVSIPVVTAAASSVPKQTASVKAPVVSKQTASVKAPADDLASSLAAHFAEQKKADVGHDLQHEAVREPEKDEHAVSPALKSVHRPKRATPRFPIAPEDVHNMASEKVQQVSAQASTVSTDTTSESHPETDSTSARNELRLSKKKRAPEPEEPVTLSVPSPNEHLDNLFNANAVEGEMGADEIEKVLQKMNVDEEWNWHPFDLNGDGKLSHKEFENAARVAQRFKVHKK